MGSLGPPPPLIRDNSSSESSLALTGFAGTLASWPAVKPARYSGSLHARTIFTDLLCPPFTHSLSPERKRHSALEKWGQSQSPVPVDVSEHHMLTYSSAY